MKLKVAVTRRTPAAQLKVGDVLITPICNGVEAFGDPTAALETIVKIVPVDSDWLEVSTQWSFGEDSSGESTHRYHRLTYLSTL